jgi:hypothetical protein
MGTLISGLMHRKMFAATCLVGVCVLASSWWPRVPGSSRLVVVNA